MDKPELDNITDKDNMDNIDTKIDNKNTKKISQIFTYIKSKQTYFLIGILVIGIGGIATYWYISKQSITNNSTAQTSNQDKSTNNSTNSSTSASTDAVALGYTYPTLKYTYNDQYTLDQAMSDNAQLSTIAFDGLAFITGSAGADTFFPPGKVADFFGFQYMRDVDTAGYGHNTTFLSKAANNIIKILNIQ